MPSPRRAFWFATAVCGPVLALSGGCSSPAEGLLDSPPDLETSAAPDARAAEGFVIPCRADQAWFATVEQREFDAGLEIADASGRPLARFAEPGRGAGLELAWQAPAVAAGDAPRRLRVLAASPAPRAARFHLRLHCLRARLDARSERAWQAVAAAADPDRATDAARRDAAVASYREAESTWRAQGQERLAAEAALQLAALHYYEREDWAPALEAAQRVAGSPAARDVPTLRAAASWLEGAARLELARAGRTGAATADRDADAWALARAALRDAQALYRQSGRPVAAAQVDVYLAGLDYERGEIDAAVTRYEAAAAALRAAGIRDDERRVAANLAAVRFDRGDFAGAARDYEALLSQAPPGDGAARLSILQNLAAAWAVTGDTERALSAFRESLDLATELGRDDAIARALAGLGVGHAQLGHGDLALTYLREAIALRRRQGRPDALARLLAQLAGVHRRRGETTLARAADLEAIELVGPDAAPALRARLQLALASDLAAAGDLPRALATLSSALELLDARAYGPVAPLLLARGRMRRLAGDPAGAAEDLARAATLARSGVDAETLIGAQVESARLALSRDDRAGARRELDAAVALIERLPAGAANPDNRQTLRTRLRDAYELRVDLLAADAQRAAARGDRVAARRSALEALRAAAATDVARPLAATGRPPVVADAAEDELHARLAARRYRLALLLESGAPPGATQRALEREIALLRTRITTGEFGAGARIDARPAGAPPPAAAAAPPGTAWNGPALPGGTTGLVYFLGETGSWRWTLTAEGVRLDPLPPRAAIEAAVGRALAEVRAARGPAPGATRELQSLERLLLPPDEGAGPAPRWRVVADGAIGAVPWSLLARRRAVESVGLLASAAAMFPAAAPGTVDASRAAPRPRRLALVGDPVFGLDDPRLEAQQPGTSAAATGTPAATREATGRALTEPEPRALARLPGTARELDALAALAALAGAEVVLQATGLEATREAVQSLPRSGVDVLHLATHAVIDPEVPELAALVLSRVDARGQPRAGSLRARDVLRMPVVPPLVVLSACDAATEPAGASEGRMNLVRAFLAAGAREVVASLWEVPDASTVELMSAFYDGLLREGLDAETALARAQSRLAAAGRWRAPFYWAGFVVTRDAP